MCMFNGMSLRRSVLCFFLVVSALQLCAQKVYFIDGYHGGIYGHYPRQYTRYIIETLDKHPDWNINIEIEPETWDSVKLHEPANYLDFSKRISDQSINGRIEYVNPAYGQGYLFNINGESIIRQFSYGINKLKEHFPALTFSTYSSEEPCFTSALPRILQSFGFKYASLKNPNTCWGGYTRAFGGELINWVGPDGTKLPTVPRYEIEALDPNSTWQTIASTNSLPYLEAAFKAGIAQPVGMCLQDAGWKNGPWLGDEETRYDTEYKTWRNYFNSLKSEPTLDWKFSQEDVQVSLVWGAQVLQKIARQVRRSENKIVSAEVLSSMASFYEGKQWVSLGFDEAWRSLLLAQHHDCWIVPYNGSKGKTWIDKVARWTGTTDSVADQEISSALTSMTSEDAASSEYFIKVFNSLGNARTEWVHIDLPKAFENYQGLNVLDNKGRIVPTQLINTVTGAKKLLIKASVPSLGYNTYKISFNQKAKVKKGLVEELANGDYKIETDHYSLIIDPSRGGVFKSMLAKKLGNKQFIDQGNARGFNELRGYFFRDSSFYSSMQHPAKVIVKEDGPNYCHIEISGMINQQPFTQEISLYKDEPLVNIKLTINWTRNVGIGNDYKQLKGYEAVDYRKAFYNDSFKLQTLFPVNIADQQVYKNAPFDVTKSELNNTFFNTWDSIKNNIILNWVDVVGRKDKHGLALFSDHTTSYAHGVAHPLGLTTQYSGVGLWGRNYSLTEPTVINYAILPHAGTWDEAGVWKKNNEWSTPLIASIGKGKNNGQQQRSLVGLSGNGIEVTAVQIQGKDLIVRLFNASPAATAQQLYFDGSAGSITEEELNGELTRTLNYNSSGNGLKTTIQMPKFGIKTIRFSNFKRSR